VYVVLCAAQASAEVVFLSSGRLLLVTAARSQTDRLVLRLRSGGELVVPRELIARLAVQHGVDARLVHAVVQAKSTHYSNAVSPKVAQGLIQIMPSTGRMHGAVDLFNPEANLNTGIRHLRGLLDQFKAPVAVAAYNAGAAAVERFGGIPPFDETRV
jgi:soluble lytic murein transglycosylase-like protein